MHLYSKAMVGGPGFMSSRISEFYDLKFMIYFECPFKLQNTSVEKIDIVYIFLHI